VGLGPHHLDDTRERAVGLARDHEVRRRAGDDEGAGVEREVVALTQAAQVPELVRAAVLARDDVPSVGRTVLHPRFSTLWFAPSGANLDAASSARANDPFVAQCVAPRVSDDEIGSVGERPRSSLRIASTRSC
jgi:hypothetical protein